MRSFAWSLAKNSIPTDETLKRRHISEDGLCAICNASVDSWHHVLVKCQMSKCVWALMEEELVEHVIACTSSDAELWLAHPQDTMSEQDFVEVLVTLWAI